MIKKSGIMYFTDDWEELRGLYKKLHGEGYVFPSSLGAAWGCSSRTARRLARFVPNSYKMIVVAPDTSSHCLVRMDAKRPHRPRGNPGFWSLKYQAELTIRRKELAAHVGDPLSGISSPAMTPDETPPEVK